MRLNRIPPRLPAHAVKTYSFRAPVQTHWRRASCEEFECDKFLHGFVLSIDTSTELGQRQYHYVTHDNTRRYSMQKTGPTLIKVIYGPGNECFSPERDSHLVQIGRQPFLLVSDGDWRGNPRNTPVVRHRNWEDWVDDFASHQERLSRAFNG